MNNRVYHSWKTGTYPCGTYFVIMRFDLLSSHLDVIGNLHHTSAVHWRFFTKLSSSICIQGSLSGMPQSLEIALHMLFVQFLKRTVFAFIWCRTPTHGYCGWYNDSCRGMSGLLEQVIIIVFTLHRRTSSSRSHNSFIHKSFIHYSSSQLPFLLFDCF